MTSANNNRVCWLALKMRVVAFVGIANLLILVSCSTKPQSRKLVGVMTPPLPTMRAATLSSSASLSAVVVPPPPFNPNGFLAWDIVDGFNQWRYFRVYTSTNVAGPYTLLTNMTVNVTNFTTISLPIKFTNRQQFWYVKASNILYHYETDVTTKKN